MVTSATINENKTNTASFATNDEYLNAYIDLIYLRAVVEGMISFAEQTGFQELLSRGIRERDYDDFGVKNRMEFTEKLRTLKKHLLLKMKEFKTRLEKSDTPQFFLERIAKEYGLSRAEIDIVATAYSITNTSRFEKLGRTNGFNSSSCNEVYDFLVMLAHTHAMRLKMKPFFGYFVCTCRIMLSAKIVYGRFFF